MTAPLRHPEVAPTERLPEAVWGPLIPDDQWNAFLEGALAVQAAAVPFVLHGAFALAAYTDRWRNTKDVDIIIRELDREPAIAALRSAGFEDYYERESYDRSWIFRGVKRDAIFDVIWDLPNHRVPIDDPWFQRAQPLWLRGRLFAIAPIEEVIRIKLYVFQRERCDWVDVLNVIACATSRIDWRWLVDRMGEDLPLLQAALAVFNWLSPQRARALPPWLRERFALPMEELANPETAEAERVRLFDSRPWFTAFQPIDRPLER
jgi:hypothetical protein